MIRRALAVVLATFVAGVATAGAQPSLEITSPQLFSACGRSAGGCDEDTLRPR